MFGKIIFDQTPTCDTIATFVWHVDDVSFHWHQGNLKLLTSKQRSYSTQLLKSISGDMFVSFFGVEGSKTFSNQTIRAQFMILLIFRLSPCKNLRSVLWISRFSWKHLRTVLKDKNCAWTWWDWKSADQQSHRIIKAILSQLPLNLTYEHYCNCMCVFRKCPTEASRK